MTGLDHWCMTCRKARGGYRDCSPCRDTDNQPTEWENVMKDETTAAVREVVAAQARTASPLIVAAKGLMDAGTVPALLAARDVIQREIARLEGK